jgi:hypothetical protein
MQYVLAILMLIHSVAHLPGFLVAWRLATLKELPYKTTVLGGALSVGDAGIRLLGVFWLLAALAFVTAAVSLLLHMPWWRTLTLSACAVSLVLCILGWPDTRFGIVANLLILALVIAGSLLQWFPVR